VSSLGYGSSGNAYIIRVRTREQCEVEVHKGGVYPSTHRRRVSHWTPWKTHRHASDARTALSQLDIVKKLNPLSDVGVFLLGRRVTIEQLSARAAEGLECVSTTNTESPSRMMAALQLIL